MKVFVAGIATETNTFSPIPTGLADFHVARKLEDRAAVSAGGVAEIYKHCQKNADEMVHSVLAFAEPSGVTVRPAYEALRDELLDHLRAHADTDMIILLLHGAMVADGYEDCELDLTTRCREIAGDKVVIGVELDLHGHIDGRLLAQADFVKSYKEYPHVDISDVAVEVYEMCRRIVDGEVTPVMALHDCKMVSLYSTFRDPMIGFVEELKQAEQAENVLAVSFNHGFPWGDVPHVGGKMLVVTDDDLPLAQTIAKDFSDKIYAIRDSARLPSIEMEEGLQQAIASPNKPVVAADQSDNAGGGAPSDSTYILKWLLDHKITNAGIAFMYDPEVVKLAIAAGEGAQITIRLGGKTSVSSGDPLDLTVQVVGIKHDYVHDFPQAGGQPIYKNAGDTVALLCEGIYVIVNSDRTQCFSPTAFTDFGITDLDLYVPKSTNHFMSGFGDMAGEVIRIAAPGAIPPIMTIIPYEKFDPSGSWPWTETAE